ncbi:MAG: sensor domain-containing diguanylate cyclase [Gammaproteobacteria bacterium]|nr:MAG: sensor domain-containing diguanylate cyclase [Gammaproteobacteria bacterium]
MFDRIEHKILAFVGLVVTLGLTATAWFYVEQQEQAILVQNERSLGQLTSSVFQTLEAIMLTGNADLARQVDKNLKHVREIEDFHILRIDGTEAFQDNLTLRSVNKRLGDDEFELREESDGVRVMADSDPNLRRAVSERSPVIFYHDASTGERKLTYLYPMLNKTACHRCHGGERAVRGVVKLTMSLAGMQADVANTRRQSINVLLVVIGIVLVLTAYVLRRSVVSPLRQVTTAMERAAKGDLSQHVPVLGKDEVGQMAASFNRMIGQLLATYTGLEHEQDKLTTIILSAGEGIVVTDKNESVVLVNPAAEELLEKPMGRIVHDGFMGLVDDQVHIRRLLAAGEGGILLPALDYKGRLLALSATRILGASGELVGSVALIRDVTEEKRLENELKQLSQTDGLTGLFNRRFMDEAIASELSRADRYSTPLSISLFDVDHFKKFNDTHGHEQGDRVLKGIAGTTRRVMRNVDLCCRYGGEEFLIIMPNTDRKGALLAAERLREAVEITRVDDLPVTISVGTATYPGAEANTSDALVVAADRAMYAAKVGGRNQVRAVEELGS